MTRRYAILTLTQGALTLGRRLQRQLPGSQLFLNRRFTSQPGERHIEQPLGELAADLFAGYDSLIWIMASGIVVRSIAPLLQHKASDPAVLVLDEAGQFVISLLSGHLGRANDDARQIAGLLDATPVITTASDVGGSLAVDTLAMALDCAIDDLTTAKTVTAEIVNGGQVGLLAPWPVSMSLPDNVRQIAPDTDCESYTGLIVISETRPERQQANQCWLIPRRIVAGVGCRRGTACADIVMAVTAALDAAAVDRRALRSLTSVDVKADEAGLIAAAAALDVPLHIVSRAQIARLESTYNTSEFVRQTIGVAGVCEPAALITSSGRLILPKRSGKGITVALAHQPETEVEEQ